MHTALGPSSPRLDPPSKLPILPLPPPSPTHSFLSLARLVLLLALFLALAPLALSLSRRTHFPMHLVILLMLYSPIHALCFEVSAPENAKQRGDEEEDRSPDLQRGGRKGGREVAPLPLRLVRGLDVRRPEPGGDATTDPD